MRRLMIQIPCLLAVVMLTGVLVGCEPDQPQHQMDYPAPRQPQQQEPQQESQMQTYPPREDSGADTQQQEAPTQWPGE